MIHNATCERENGNRSTVEKDQQRKVLLKPSFFKGTKERLKMLDTLTQIANSAHNIRVQCTLYYDHRASISKTVTMNW